jgi:catechol 2,3-dioxygenase-like lactoylglutathione lyase family enzyme
VAIIGNYHHVHLTSPDPRAAAEWYEEFLGGKIVDDAELRGARNVRVTLGESFLFIRGERADESISPPRSRKATLWGRSYLLPCKRHRRNAQGFYSQRGRNTPAFI